MREVRWEHVVRPRLKAFETMKTSWSEGETVPEDSVWYPNWAVPDRG